MRVRIDRKLLNRMKSLAREIGESFKSFYLAGGTAIMFKYQHRMSTNLTFFRYREFSKKRMIRQVMKMFPRGGCGGRNR